ncbi:MAG: Pathogenicity locus [Firmicutes bacterium]|nr:Pathogenicity locus [Bacillota bacterium]
MNKLQSIPGIGVKMAEDLLLLGIKSPQDLIGEDPELLYQRLCAIKGYKVDRCVLYVFRCAVYYANEKEHDPEKLKWWKWKDVD